MYSLSTLRDVMDVSRIVEKDKVEAKNTIEAKVKEKVNKNTNLKK